VSLDSISLLDSTALLIGLPEMVQVFLVILGWGLLLFVLFSLAVAAGTKSSTRG